MDGTGAELCDVCGTVLTDGNEQYALVPDSSVIHGADPRMDGHRLIVACGSGHLEQLREQYAARPWTDEELWAGQIVRAIVAAGAGVGLTPADLSTATGLAMEQIARALRWQQDHDPHP